MKRSKLVLFVAGFMAVTSLQAQSVQDGKNDLYKQRYKSAKAVFEKLIAANPNDLDAIYWLGQTYIMTEDVPAAKSLYEKTLATNGNAPLILVGMGHTELYDQSKTNEARQRFETALTMTANKRKGNDPDILNAVGEANADAKYGDLNYAIERLKEAIDRDGKNPEIYLNLGNAYRKAFPGQAGGDAYQAYQNAVKINPKFAIAHYRTAKLFETQKNWIVWLEHMNNAVDADPSFAPAYYDLYYYFLGNGNFERAEEYAQKFIANADPDVNNKYFAVQTKYAKKEYDDAIAGAKEMINEGGDEVNPKVYKMIAYCYVAKGDTLSAKDYVDTYFVKEKTDKVISEDYVLKALVYMKVPGQMDVAYNSILEGVKLDTSLQNKIKTLQDGADKFKKAGNRCKAGDLLWEAYKLSPEPNQRDVFDPGLEYYFCGNYDKALEPFTIYSQKWPDQVYGWQWLFNTQRAIDTTGEMGLYAPTGDKLLEVLYQDSVKNKPSILQTLAVMATYHVNTEKGKDLPKAVEYLERYLSLDPENEAIKSNIETIKKVIGNTSSGSTSKSSGTGSKK
ncbi:MAG: tetratricopeptide repeat protein [Terrimonas sp.]|nr:tetratricopeptide repeat protein [Terrimonas sp.]